MSRYCGSGSAMLTHLWGTQEDTEFALDETASLKRDLNDLYKIMLQEPEYDSEDVEESDDEKEEKSPSQHSPLSIVYNSLQGRKADPNECSICFCEFDEVVAELDCGHRFCKSCVELYLSLTISANPNLVHKRSFSRRDDEISVSIRQLDLVGVRCPHFNCLGVIGEAKIKDLADKRTYDKFDQFALDQALTQMHRKKELRSCPFECGYFTQDECLCVNPDCRKEQIRLRTLEKKHLERLVHKSDDFLEKWAVANPNLVKLCPLGCYSMIEKNGGCDHMYCIKCSKIFFWTQALPFTSQNNWLNKARAELAMRKKNPPKGVIYVEEESV